MNTDMRMSWLRWWRTPAARWVAVGLIACAAVVSTVTLWSIREAPARLDRVAVAVVNDDQPVDAAGFRLNAGESLTNYLKANPVFQWSFVDSATAQDQLQRGDIGAVLRIPPDYSTSIASLDSGTPRQAVLEFTTNDATDPAFTTQSAALVDDLTRSLGQTVTLNFLDEVYDAIQPARDTGETTAQATAKLATDLTAAAATANAAGAAVTNLGAAAQSAGTNLAAAASTLTAANTTATTLVSETTASTATATTLSQSTASVASGLADVQRQLTDRGLADLASQVGALASTFNTGIATPATTLTQQSQQSATTAKQLSDEVKSAQQAVTKSQEAITAAAASTTQTGSDLAALSTTLNNQMLPAAQDIEARLAAAAAKVTPISAAQRESLSTVLTAPIMINTQALNPVNTWGAVVAPASLALAVGLAAILLVGVLGPVSRLALAGGQNTAKSVLARSLTLGSWSLAQLIFVVLGLIALSLGVAAWAPLVAMLVLGAVAATSFVQLMSTLWGRNGLYLAGALLLIQQAALAVLWPRATLLAPFDTLGYLLPANYFADGVARSIAGGPMMGSIIIDIGMLIVTAAGCLLLTMWIAGRRRGQLIVTERA